MVVIDIIEIFLVTLTTIFATFPCPIYYYKGVTFCPPYVFYLAITNVGFDIVLMIILSKNHTLVAYLVGVSLEKVQIGT